MLWLDNTQLQKKGKPVRENVKMRFGGAKLHKFATIRIRRKRRRSELC